ncbi:DASH family cryptochrome [Aquabacterium sp.]|uniref:DASH family cryptochrome n=1 Tax=Aquabacterium sp. TaxID=1872578 RepID=UPI00341C3C91
MSCVVHWFRNDLRVSDNPALLAAIAEAQVRGLPLLPVFVWDPAQAHATRWVPQRMGRQRQAWLAGTVAALDAELQARGSRLQVLHGAPEALLPEVLEATQALALHAEDIPAPEEADQAKAIGRAAKRLGASCTWHWQSTMLAPDDLPFSPQALPAVFTTFRQQIEQASIAPRTPLPAPQTLPPAPELPAPHTGHIPHPATLCATASPDARSSFPFHQPTFAPGERGAQAHLAQYFARRMPHSYKATRNGLSGTDFSSKLSPWLATGALSAAQAIAAIRGFEAEHGANDGSYWLWFELLWREHFRLLHLKHGSALYRARGLSQLPTPPHDEAAFQRWREGRTGEPLVDAGMRELAATGWLSNRLRQMVASYLVHDLACDWRAGAAWFEACLIDFDVHSNQGNWLYVSGRGTDPRGGRRFNPDKQTREHDPDGAYRRLWGTA